MAALSRGSDGWWNWPVELAETPDWRVMLIAELNGRAIGFLQIIDPAREPTCYWGDCGPGLRAIDIWIGEAAALGQGHGTAMMRQALEHCFASPEIRAVLVDPLSVSHRAHRFYQRLGFRPVERRRFGGDDCLVHRLGRDDWQVMREG